MTQPSARFPDISVVIPTHRRPQELRRAVTSALHQDYEGRVVVVVVFDGEEPYELDLVLPRNRELKSIANWRQRGLAGARNSGIAATSTELVAFLDDDDEWLPGKLTAQYAIWRATEPRPVAVGCGILMVGGPDEVVRAAPEEPVTYEDLLNDRVMELHSSGVLLAPGRLPDTPTIDEALPGSYAEDYDLLLRAARIAPIPSADAILVRVAWGGGSHFASKWLVIAEALEYLLSKYPDFADHRLGYARIAGQISFAYASAGQRSEANRWARQALTKNPAEKKALLGVLVNVGLVKSAWVQEQLQKRGRGL